MGVRLESCIPGSDWRSLLFTSSSKPTALLRDLVPVLQSAGLAVRFVYDCEAYGLPGVGRVEICLGGSDASQA